MPVKHAKSEGRSTRTSVETKTRSGPKAKAEVKGKAVAAAKGKSTAKAAAGAKGKTESRTGARARTATVARPAPADKAAATAKAAHGAKATVPAKAQAKTRAPAEPTPEPVGPPPESTREEVELPPGYRPSGAEPYMNAQQLEYFRRKLLEWRESLLRESQQTIDHLRSDGASRYVGDEADRARDESEVALELRTRDRYRKLLPKIDAALRRIEDGSYGYCEETGEPIGLKRLEARPIATLSVEAQEIRERAQRGYRDDV
jgi:DnaK suppressor protein